MGYAQGNKKIFLRPELACQVVRQRSQTRA